MRLQVFSDLHADVRPPNRARREALEQSDVFEQLPGVTDRRSAARCSRLQERADRGEDHYGRTSRQRCLGGSAGPCAVRWEAGMSIDLSLLSPDAVTPALTAKLRSLAHDLDRIAVAAAPTAAELAKAPLLVDWRIVLSLSGLALTGFAAGHPLLGARAIVTSPLWVLDPELCWARTLSRFYRLGVPEGGAIPAGDAS